MFTRTKILVAALGIAIAAPSLPAFAGQYDQAPGFTKQQLKGAKEAVRKLRRQRSDRGVFRGNIRGKFREAGKFKPRKRYNGWRRK